MSDFTKLKVAELKAELDARSVTYGARAKKAELLELLQNAADGGSQENEENDADEVSVDVEKTVKVTSKKRKAEESESSPPPEPAKKRTKSGSTATPSSSKTATASKAVAGSKGKGKATSSKKSPKKKAAPVLNNTFLPVPLLELIQSFIDPTDLRTHVALSGVQKTTRKALYPTDDAWKVLALRAGYGRPMAALGHGSTKKKSWQQTVVEVSTCVGIKAGLPFDFKVWQGESRTAFFKSTVAYHTLMRACSTLTESFATLKPEVLSPDQIASTSANLKVNPLLEMVNPRDWSSIHVLQTTACDPAVFLGSRPSVANSLATCAPASALGIAPGFALASNPDGVCVSDVWSALLKRLGERVMEPDLQKLFASERKIDVPFAEWPQVDKIAYSQWMRADLAGASYQGFAYRRALLLPSTCKFQGEVHHLESGSLLLVLGFDGDIKSTVPRRSAIPVAYANASAYHHEEYSDEDY